MNERNLIELAEHIAAYHLTRSLDDCADICGGIVETLEEMQFLLSPEHADAIRDAQLNTIWRRFGDIPIDDKERIDDCFYIWEKGTSREEIWHWFDERHSKGVAYLLGVSEAGGETVGTKPRASEPITRPVFIFDMAFTRR